MAFRMNRPVRVLLWAGGWAFVLTVASVFADKAGRPVHPVTFFTAWAIGTGASEIGANLSKVRRFSIEAVLRGDEAEGEALLHPYEGVTSAELQRIVTEVVGEGVKAMAAQVQTTLSETVVEAKLSDEQFAVFQQIQDQWATFSPNSIEIQPSIEVIEQHVPPPPPAYRSAPPPAPPAYEPNGSYSHSVEDQLFNLDTNHWQEGVPEDFGTNGRGSAASEVLAHTPSVEPWG